MDRVTLPKVVHKVELEEQPDIVRRASIPAGQSLPAWEYIPLDAKFPMIPAPKGSVVLATTDLSQPKHCATKEHDFDLTDPNAFIMSNDYSALHDPHLKAHFSSMYMRKHLIRNGFITPEGQVVCSLREFNEYRRYLRRLCLLELAREKRQKEKEALGTVDEKVEEKEGKAIQDLRQRILEQEKAQRQKLADSMAESAKRLEKRQKEMIDKQLKREIKRKENEDKRRQILSQIHKSERNRSNRLMEKWEVEDQKRQDRLAKMRKRQVRSQQQKVISKWNERRRFQENRLAYEAERREELDKEKQQRVENRKNKMKRHWKKQAENLENLRQQSAMKRDTCRRTYERRMTVMMSGDAGRRSNRSYLQSPFQSLWVIEKVLRRLSFPDIYCRVVTEDTEDENELWEFLDGVINQAVDVLKTEGGPDELDILREGAQALVMKTIEGITQEKFPELLICVDEPSPEPPEELPNILIDEPHQASSHEQATVAPEETQHAPSGEQFIEPVDEQPSKPSYDGDYQLEHMIISTDEAKESKSDENTAPAPSPAVPDALSSSELTQSTLEIQGVSLNILRHSMIRLDKVLPDNSVVDTQTALSGLNLLLDDIAIDRCSRQELEMIVGYAAPGHGWWDSGTNNIVEIMLKSILSELRTGNVNNESLTRLILSLVGVPVEQVSSQPDKLKDFLPAILHDITQQYEIDSLSDDQVQCLSTAITSLFLDPELEIAGTTVSDILDRLIKGTTGTSKQKKACIAACKTILGKILKHMAYFMSDWESNNQTSQQVANAIASETMFLLGDQLSDEEASPNDAVGSSIIAEWIISQVLNELAQYGPIHHSKTEDIQAKSETSVAAKAVVTDILSSLKSQMVGKKPQISEKQDTTLVINDVVTNVVKCMADPTAFQSKDVKMEVPDMAMAIVRKTFTQLANIISATDTGISGTEERDYLFTKSLVADTFREMGHAVMPGKTQNQNTPLENKLITQILEDMGEYRVVSSVICENLLRHESCSVAQQILLEALKQMTSLFTDAEELKRNKKCSKIVSESLKALASATTDASTSTSTSSVATRIVNETLKGLRGSITESGGRKKDKNTENTRTVNNTVWNTLNALLDPTSQVYTTSELDACTADFESLAKHMACETLHQAVKTLLNGNVDISTNRHGSGRSDMEEKLICETIRHLMQSLLFSTAIVQDNMDLDICFAASQTVRYTLQQLSETMARSVPYTQPGSSSAINVQVTEGILKMAKALSDGSMSIGDKQNLTLPIESKKLVNVIKENLINLTDDSVSTEAQYVVSNALKQTASAIFESLATSDEHHSDTLVLAGRMVNDILNEIASFVSSCSKAEYCDLRIASQPIVEDVMHKLLNWASTWPTVAIRATSYDLNGCAIIAGDIVKRLLTKLAKDSYQSDNTLADASHQFVSILAVSDILNRLSFGATVIVDNNMDLFENSGLGKQTDRDILKHLIRQIQDNHLSLKELISLAEAIVPTYSIVNFPTLNRWNSNALADFVIDLLTKVCSDIDANKYSEVDLAEIRDSLLQQDQERAIQRRFADLQEFGSINIRELIERVKRVASARELQPSEIDRIARYILRDEGTSSIDMEGNSPDITRQASDKVMTEIIQKNRNRLSSGELSNGEIKRKTARIVEACAFQTPNGNETEMPVANIMDTMKTVTGLNSLIGDIEDGAFTSYEICRLAYAIVSSASGKDPVLSVSEVSVQGMNATLASLIMDQLMEVLLILKDYSTGETMADRMSNIMLSTNAHEPLSKDLIDPLAWNDVSELLLNITRTVSERLLSRVTSLMSSGTVQIVCDDTQWSNSYITNRNIPRLDLRGIDRIVLERFVKVTLETIARRQTALESKADIYFQKRGPKHRSVEAKKTKAILVTLSKTYRDLEDILFHPLASLKQNVEVSVQRALLQLIHDIDYSVMPMGDIDSLGNTLLQWWNDNKANYEYVAADDAMKLVSSLIDKIKNQSKIVGPPRRNEPFAMVRLTEERVRSFVEEVIKEEPAVLTVISNQALLTPCTSVANQIVQTVLRALEDDTWLDDELEKDDNLKDKDDHTLADSNDLIATKVISSLFKRLDSHFVDDLAQDITNFLLEKLETEGESGATHSSLMKTQKGIRSVGRVKSVLENVPTDVKGVTSIRSSPAVATASSLMAQNLVFTVTDALQAESTTSFNAAECVRSLMQMMTLDDYSYVSNLGICPSDLAHQTLELALQRVLKDMSSDTLVPPKDLSHVSSLDICSSDIAQQTVELVLQRVLKEDMSGDILVRQKASSSLLQNPSELAERVVKSTIRVLLTNENVVSVSNQSVDKATNISLSSQRSESKTESTHKISRENKTYGSKTVGKLASSKSVNRTAERNESLKSKSSSSKAKQETIDLTPVKGGKSSNKTSAKSLQLGKSEEHTPAKAKSRPSQESQTIHTEGSVRESLSQVLKKTNQQQEATGFTSQTSQVVLQAVQSLAKVLENASIEPTKIESYVQKAEEGDPVLVDVIEKASNISPSESLTEHVVQMIMAALNNESQTETAKSAEVSAKSSLAAKVVTSLMKLIDRYSPESSPEKSKSASSAVAGLIDTMEKDLQKTIRRSQTNKSCDVANKVPSTPGESKRTPTTLDRIKEILQQIIQDVSANRLTTDQIEDIAASAAGEMVKKFSFQPLSNVQSPSSVRVIATIQSIINDIDNGNFSIDMVAPNTSGQNNETNQAETDQTQHNSKSAVGVCSPHSKTAIDQTNNIENLNISSDKTKEPNESISTIMKDILNRVLIGIKSSELSTSHSQEHTTGNDEIELYKQDRVRSWILESRVYCDDSHLVQSIAEESINKTIDKIIQGTISPSECCLITEAIFQEMPGKRKPTYDDDEVREFVLGTLEYTLRSIQKDGLSSKTIDSLVKAVLQVILLGTEPLSPSSNTDNPSASKRNNVVRFLAKILGHLLSVTRNTTGAEDEDTCTEKDSLLPVVVSQDLHDGSEVSLDQASVKITPTIGGRELHLDNKTTSKALSTISIRGTSGTVNPHDPIARNSFRNLHRPELTRTEALSHGQPEDVEAKLQKVAEQNVHLVHSVEDGELTTIAEVAPSRTCSSSSQSRSPSADLDGQLQNVISLISPSEEPAMEVKVSENPSVIRSNTNTNSPKPPKAKSPRKTSVAPTGNKSPRKTTKVDTSNKYPVSNKAGNKCPVEVKSPTTVTSGKSLVKTPPTQSKVSIRCGSSQLSLKLPQIKSPSLSKTSLKQRRNSSRMGRSTPVKDEALFPSSSKDKETVFPAEKTRHPVRVQSLCGSHSTCVTVREVDNGRT